MVHLVLLEFFPEGDDFGIATSVTDILVLNPPETRVLLCELTTKVV